MAAAIEQAMGNAAPPAIKTFTISAIKSSAIKSNDA